MVKSILTTLAVVTVSVTAAALEPINPCTSGLYNCTAPMQAIAEKFDQATGVDPQVIDTTVFSGSCYHLGTGFNGLQEHHGLLFFSSVAGNPHIGGVFSFFAPKNPYDQVDINTAKKNYVGYQKPNHAVSEWNENYTFVDYQIKKPPFRLFWYKQDPQSGHLLVISYWGDNYVVTCEMAKNQPAQ